MANSVKQPEVHAVETDIRKVRRQICEFDFISFEAKRHA